MMKGLAIYSIIALSGFAVYSIYFAVIGDNSPFWVMIAVACLPAIVFALLYLVRKH